MKKVLLPRGMVFACSVRSCKSVKNVGNDGPKRGYSYILLFNHRNIEPGNL